MTAKQMFFSDRLESMAWAGTAAGASDEVAVVNITLMSGRDPENNIGENIHSRSTGLHLPVNLILE
jgi:hypothetical protein